MPRVFQGDRSAAGRRFAIVVSRYNESVTSKLLEGALHTLSEHGAELAHVDVAWVPGAWEIPLVADRMAATGRYGAVLCLGAVVRGETAHDRYISGAVSQALAGASLRHGVPLLFGVLTCDTLEQAIHRSGGNRGNKGSECAAAATEMVSLLDKLPATADG